MSGIRELARVMFEQHWRLLNRDCLTDFANAKAVLLDAVHDPHCHVDRTLLGTLRFTINNLDGWSDFFNQLCGHRLFSDATPQICEFVALWRQIAGFDVDGLLEIGDPGAARADWFLAKHQLGHKLGKLWFGGEDERDDEHVHFGQYVDFNILWHYIIGCADFTLDNVWDSGARSERIGGNLERAPLLGSAQRRLLDDTTQLCRLVMGLFHADSGYDEALEQVFPVDCASAGLKAPDRLRFGSIVRGFTAKPLRQRLLLERKLFALLREDCDTSRYALARAYTLAKNAAFHRLLSNSVLDFEGFSWSLAVVKSIYRQAKPEIDKIENLSVFADHLAHSQSIASAPRLRFRLEKMKHESFKEDLRYQKLLLHNIIGERSHSVVVAVHREDFENISREDQNAQRDKIVSDHGGWGLTLVGVDLIGPEARSRSSSPDREAGGTSERILLDSVDFVFDLRQRLESERRHAAGRPETETETEIFATFHVGESVTNPVIGMIGLLLVLADNRFRPTTDRISHGLVLAEPMLPSSPLREPAVAAIDAALGRLLTDTAGYWKNRLLFAEEVAAIQAVLRGYRDESRSVARFPVIQDIIIRTIDRNQLTIEVCPFSNYMIRGMDFGHHVWASQYKGNRQVLVGTDDPSLTQTLPWMERAFLAG